MIMEKMGNARAMDLQAWRARLIGNCLRIVMGIVSIFISKIKIVFKM
jgi:hypothetical protein